MTVALRRLIFVATVFVGLSLAHSIHDKCRACNAVAEELELGMMKIKEKNDSGDEKLRGKDNDLGIVHGVFMFNGSQCKEARRLIVAQFILICRLPMVLVSHVSKGKERCLQESLFEKPKNHLDMRHRLDSKGQRRGKVIDYRVSELRVVDLLDGLCDKMQDYTLQKVDSTKKIWMKVDDWDNITSNKQESRAYSKEISSYCGRLLEETEDELAELIKKGSVKVGEVSKVLCHDLSKQCNSAPSHQQESSHDEEEDEIHGEL